MAETFDPYHRWLSIPPEEQPPNHYRLLGLKVLEDDADVIESAADRQMTHVRTFQSGKFAEQSQRILNEISAAKVALLDPTKKAAYDAPLRAKLAEAQRVKRVERPLAVAQPLTPLQPATALPPNPQPPTVAPPTAETTPDPFAHATHGISAPKLRRQKSTSPAVMLALVGVVAVTLAAFGAVAAIVRPWESPTSVAENDPPLIAPPPFENNNPPPPVEPPAVKPPIVKPPPTQPPEDEPADEPPSDEPEDVVPPDDDLEEPPLDEPEEELAPPERLPVPAKAERDAQRAKIDAIFQTAKAKTPAEKAELAAQLLRTAGETPDDPVAVFVMLNLARELASDAARMQLAFDAIDLLEQQFDFDADPVRILTIAQGAKSAVPNDAKQEVVTLGVELANQFAAADKYEDAGKVLNGLVDLARRAREPQVAAVLIEHRRVNDALFTAYKAAQGALETLKTSPDDPAANLAVGRFHLIVKKDAARGLTHLAKGDNAALAAAAKLELTNPNKPDEQEQLADAWWNLAAKEDDKETKQQLQARAMAWYQRVQPELKGLGAAKADKRLHELADAGVQPAEINLDLGVFDDASTATPKPRRLPSNLLDLVDVETHKINQTWTRDGIDIVSPNAYAALLKVPVTIDGGYDATLEFTRTDGHELVGLVLPVGDHYCDVLMSIGGGTIGGISKIRGSNGLEDGPASVRPSPLTNNERHTLRVRVVLNGEDVAIDTAVDGKPFARWQGLASDLSVGDVRKLPQPGHFGLYAHEAKVEFHALRLRMLSGSATPDDDVVLPRPVRPTTSSTTGDVTSDLVAHWKFDEGSGAVATDAVAGLKGEIRGATWVSGARGKALRFDGKDDSVLLGNPAALNFDGPLTIAAWVRTVALPPQTTQGDGFIANVISHGYAYDARREVRLSLEHAQTGPQWVGVAWHGETSTTAAGKFDPHDLGQWAHVAMTCDGTAWRMYRNGRLIGEKATTQLAVAVPADWAIAAHSGGSFRNFNGDIDELRIYRRGLAAEDIRTLYLGKTSTASAASVSPADPDEGLVAHWKFDEGEGTVARDSIGGHDGTIEGPTRTKGIRGGAMRFDGADDKIVIANDDDLNFEGALTISAWTKLATPLTAERWMTNIVSHGRTEQPPRAVVLRMQLVHDEPCYLLSSWTGSATNLHAKTPNADLGHWVHLVGVWEQDKGRLYRNGKLVASNAANFGAVKVDEAWVIGNDVRGDRCYHGEIDDVRIYNRGLSADEVKTLYLGKSSTSSIPRVDALPRSEPVAKGLVAHWKFDDAKGTVATDSVGKGDGEVRGATWIKGVRGGALRFDGKDDLVFIGQPNALNLAGEISVSLFVRPLSETPTRGEYPGVANVIARGFVMNPEREFAVRQLRPVNGGPAYWNLHANNGSDNVGVDASKIELEKWEHLVVVYDGTAWRFYSNGKLQATKASQISLPLFDGGWAIGGHASDPRPFHGEIDDVRIYNRGLSADEVKSLATIGDPAPSNDGAALPRRPARETLPAAPLPSPVIITRAVYGAGEQVVDVTEKVRAALAADPFAPLQADDRAMGDPASGTPKELVITYAVAGKPQTVRLNQPTPVHLPQLPEAGIATKDASKDFRILAARFGAGLTWVDITDAVRGTVTRTDVAYQWSFQKTDPWFGVPKRTSIWFDYRGKRYHRFFTDGETQALLH